jgi:hypothetical protein
MLPGEGWRFAHIWRVFAWPRRFVETSMTPPCFDEVHVPSQESKRICDVHNGFLKFNELKLHYIDNESLYEKQLK